MTNPIGVFILIRLDYITNRFLKNRTVNIQQAIIIQAALCIYSILTSFYI